MAAPRSLDNSITYYFNTLDTTKSGKVYASDAASFFRRSGIQDAQLAHIWELCDRLKSGYLTLQDFAIALKLIALAQNGHAPTLENIKMNAPAPVFKGFDEPRGTPPARPSRPSPVDKSEGWVVTKAMKSKYDAIFQSLKPINGKLSGTLVKPILLKSQLHVNVLGQIWELSDIDKDGCLDIDEFSLAMYLLQRSREGESPPQVLPLNYIPPSHCVIYTRVQKITWHVPPAIRLASSEEFRSIDTTGAGVLSGAQLRPLLLRRGAPMKVLAHIWALCDINTTGMLNEEQYSLAVHLITTHQSGKALPKSLPLELIPPSLRSTASNRAPATSSNNNSPILPPRTAYSVPISCQQFPASKTGTLPVMSAAGKMSAAIQMSIASHAFKSQTLAPQKPVPPPPQPKAGNIAEELASLNLGSGIDINADFSIIKELDTYTKETDTLTAEKSALQQEIKCAENNLSNAGIELVDLKEQLSKLEREVEEARNVRDEIQAKVDEADAERRKYEELISDMHNKALAERQQITALQQQIASQEALRRAQEDELQKARDELSKLRQEESHYLHQVETGKRQLDTLMMNLRTVQSDTNQTQAKLVQIEAARRSIDKTLIELAPLARRAAEGKPSILTNIHEVSQLSKQEQDVTQMSDITRATAGSSPVSSMSGFSVDLYPENQQHDPFASTPSSTTDSFQYPFGAPDPFQGDPFSNTAKLSIKGRDVDNISTSSVDVIEENGVDEKTSASNTPRLLRKNEDKKNDFTFQFDTSIKTTDNDPFTSKNDKTPFTDNVYDTNPFGAPSTNVMFSEVDDPFKSSITEDDPFKSRSDPFASVQGGDDPFQANSDPFQPSTSDPFLSVSTGPFSSKTSPEEDDFKSAEGDPFKSSNDDPFKSSQDDPFKSSREDPFTSSEDDPFAEKDGFKLSDPFAQTTDPFASTEDPDPFKKNDLFKSSTNSLASSGPPLPAKGNLGSKGSLNNFGSKNSLGQFGSKSSLTDNVSQVSETSSYVNVEISTEAQPVDLFANINNKPPIPDPFTRSKVKTDDPFPSDSKDPFGVKTDPFAPTSKPDDPFAASGSIDPFAGQEAGSPDPFGPTVAEDDPFSSQSGTDDPFAPKSGKDDPFGGTSFDANFS